MDALFISVTLIIYLGALLAFVGWFLFCIYVGIGLVAVPMDLFRCGQMNVWTMGFRRTWVSTFADVMPSLVSSICPCYCCHVCPAFCPQWLQAPPQGVLPCRGGVGGKHPHPSSPPVPTFVCFFVVPTVFVRRVVFSQGLVVLVVVPVNGQRNGLRKKAEELIAVGERLGKNMIVSG